VSAKLVFEDMGVGVVEFRTGEGPSFREPEDAPKELLDVLLGGNVGYRAEDVGKGAVPAFLEGLNRDDVFDRARGGEEIDPVKLTVRACDNGELLLLDLLGFQADACEGPRP